jgi:hypothetical protein
MHSFDAAADGAAAAKASFAVSSARSVSTTLYPEGMHALLQQNATEAAFASEASKLRAAADANRLVASVAAFKVVDSIRLAVLRRLSQFCSPAAAVATVVASNAEHTIVATGGDKTDIEQRGNSKSQTTSGLKDFSNEVAARAAERSAAEVAAAAVAASSNLAKVKSKIRPLPNPTPSTTNHSDASKRSVPSSSTPTGSEQLTTAGTSTAAAALVASSTRSSVCETESLRSILARLNLLQLEVFCPCLSRQQYPPTLISQEPLLTAFPTPSSLRAATAAAVRKALVHVTPSPSMTDVVRLVHELHPPAPSSALSKMSPSPPPPKSAKTPPPPAASPAGRSKHISANMIIGIFTAAHLTF